MHRIEQHTGTPSDPSPPLDLLWDPFELYDEALAAHHATGSSFDPRGKSKVSHVDDDEDTPEEYHDEDDNDDNDDDDDGDNADDKDYEE